MLPQSCYPITQITLPVSKKKVKIRPFTVREEKVLLTSKEFGNSDDVTASIVNIVDGCTNGKVKGDTLCIPDLVAVFTEIMKASTGSTVTHVYRCKNHVVNDNGEDKECNSKITVNVNLNDIKFTEPVGNPLVNVNGKVYIKMKYPSIADCAKALEESKEDDDTYNLHEQLTRMCAYSVESIVDDETVYDDYTSEELVEWIKNLPIGVKQEMVRYIEGMPKVSLEYDVVCNKCGNKTHIKLTELQDFFTSDLHTGV